MLVTNMDRVAEPREIIQIRGNEPFLLGNYSLLHIMKKAGDFYLFNYYSISSQDIGRTQYNVIIFKVYRGCVCIYVYVEI